MMSGWRHDVRYALRSARRSPGIVVLAVVTLAVGVGGTTAIHGFVSGILLSPLPYDDPERLVVITRNHHGQGFSGMMMPPRDVVTVMDENRSLSTLTGYAYRSVNLSGGDIPEMVRGGRALPGLLATLGFRPVLGRGFDPDEVERGERVVILSDALWQRRFGGATDVLEQDLRIDGEAHRIIGVLAPEHVLAPRPVALLTSMSVGALRSGDTGAVWLLGRLRQEVSVSAAHDDVNGALERWEEENRPHMGGWRADVESVPANITGGVRRTLLVLFGAVGLVLLIACANVANLLLMRGIGRTREMFVRASLGAGRMRLIRQLLTEGALLGLVACVLGIAFASVSLRALLAWIPAGIPRIEEVTLDVGVLGFAVTASLVTGVFASLAPAWSASRVELSGVLGTVVTGRRFAKAMTVVQVSLALALSIGAALLLESFIRLVSVDPGFDAESVVTMNVALPAHRYDDASASSMAVTNLLDEVAAVPEVAMAAASTWTLMSGSWGRAQMSVEAISGDAVEREQWPTIMGVTQGYFRVVGLPLLRGRDFERDERRPESSAVIVTEGLAESAWPGVDPIGKRIKYGGPDSEQPWFTVVGVTADARLVGLALESQDGLFQPLLSSDRAQSFVQLAVRTRGGPTESVPSIRDAVWRVDAELPVSDVETIEALIARNVSQPRFNVAVLAAFAWAALLMAAIGIYGVISYAVTQRRQEIGVRLAIGAERRDIVGMVLRQGLTLVGAGLVLGGVLAFVLARWLQSFLYEVSATDPSAFAVGAAVLGTIGLVATGLPAARAARLDPCTILRGE